MHNLCLIMFARNTIFIHFLRITLPKKERKYICSWLVTKASCEISSIKDFLSKGGKSEKTHNYTDLSLLIQLFRKNYFDLQMPIDRVHLVKS